MASWRNRAPTSPRYADCIKDVTRSSHLQPTAFVVCRNCIARTKSGCACVEIPMCAVVVPVITSGVYTREWWLVGRRRCSDINTTPCGHVWLQICWSNYTDHCCSKRGYKTKRLRSVLLRETLETLARNLANFIRARCSEMELLSLMCIFVFSPLQYLFII